MLSEPDGEPSEPDGDPVADDRPEPASFMRTAIRWLIVCSISAVPSFFFGLAVTNGQIAAMVLGILIFAIGYTLLDFGTAEWRFRRNPVTRRTMKITYGTRIAISIIFPVGAAIDLCCGVLSVGLTEMITGGGLRLAERDSGAGTFASFLATVFTTIVQGLVMNAVMAVYALIVHAIQLAFGAAAGSARKQPDV